MTRYGAILWEGDIHQHYDIRGALQGKPKILKCVEYADLISKIAQLNFEFLGKCLLILNNKNATGVTAFWPGGTTAINPD
jgi:hypothetical protein